MVNAVKVFKKTAPNGKITVYLGRRDFINNTLTTDPIDGVVLIDNDYLRGRKVFGTVSVTYRYGREEEEMMGLHFSKEMLIAAKQIYPSNEKDDEVNDMQERLTKKLGGNAFPFHLTLPESAPCSVQLQPGEMNCVKPLGVIYELKVFVGDTADEKPHKRNSVTLAVRKIQYVPVSKDKRKPSTLVSKGFTLSTGKLNLEVNLDREIYYHGEQVKANLTINNGSKKAVKTVEVAIIQHVEVTMTNSHFTREVASMESKDGCPINPNSKLSKAFTLLPLASNNKKKYAVALDGKLKECDGRLASSVIVGSDVDPNDALGIIVAYSLRVRLNCGALGGELMADLPFKLVKPVPGTVVRKSEEGYFHTEIDEDVTDAGCQYRRDQSVESIA